VSCSILFHPGARVEKLVKIFNHKYSNIKPYIKPAIHQDKTPM